MKFQSVRILYFVFIFSVLFFSAAFAQESVPGNNVTKKFTKKECRQAVRWINRDLTLLMGSGILKKIVAKHNKYDLYVGKPWYALEFESRGDILKNISRSRETMGHSPFLKIFDDVSGKIVASVSEQKIEIQFKKEGFFQYLVPGDKPENTIY